MCYFSSQSEDRNSHCNSSLIYIYYYYLVFNVYMQYNSSFEILQITLIVCTYQLIHNISRHNWLNIYNTCDHWVHE